MRKENYPVKEQGSRDVRVAFQHMGDAEYLRLLSENLEKLKNSFFPISYSMSQA